MDKVKICFFISNEFPFAANLQSYFLQQSYRAMNLLKTEFVLLSDLKLAPFFDEHLVYKRIPDFRLILEDPILQIGIAEELSKLQVSSIFIFDALSSQILEKLKYQSNFYFPEVRLINFNSPFQTPVNQSFQNYFFQNSDWIQSFNFVDKIDCFSQRTIKRLATRYPFTKDKLNLIAESTSPIRSAPALIDDTEELLLKIIFCLEVPDFSEVDFIIRFISSLQDSARHIKESIYKKFIIKLFIFISKAEQQEIYSRWITKINEIPGQLKIETEIVLTTCPTEELLNRFFESTAAQITFIGVQENLLNWTCRSIVQKAGALSFELELSDEREISIDSCKSAASLIRPNQYHSLLIKIHNHYSARRLQALHPIGQRSSLSGLSGPILPLNNSFGAYVGPTFNPKQFIFILKDCERLKQLASFISQLRRTKKRTLIFVAGALNITSSIQKRFARLGFAVKSFAEIADSKFESVNVTFLLAANQKMMFGPSLVSKLFEKEKRPTVFLGSIFKCRSLFFDSTTEPNDSKLLALSEQIPIFFQLNTQILEILKQIQWDYDDRVSTKIFLHRGIKNELFNCRNAPVAVFQSEPTEKLSSSLEVDANAEIMASMRDCFGEDFYGFLTSIAKDITKNKSTDL